MNKKFLIFVLTFLTHTENRTAALADSFRIAERRLKNVAFVDKIKILNLISLKKNKDQKAKSQLNINNVNQNIPIVHFHLNNTQQDCLYNTNIDIHNRSSLNTEEIIYRDLNTRINILNNIRILNDGLPDITDFSKIACLDEIYFNKYKSLNDQSWQLYFDARLNIILPNEIDILFKNYFLYQFPNYIKFLKTFEAYNSEIVELQNKILNDPKFRSELYKQNFPFDLIANESNKIEIDDIKDLAQKVEEKFNKNLKNKSKEFTSKIENLNDQIKIWKQKKNNLKASDPLFKYYQARIDAAQNTLKNDQKFDCSYGITNNSADLLKNLSIDSNKFTNLRGNLIQQQIHKEIVETINKASEINSKHKLNEPINRIITLTDLAYEFNNAGQIQQAETLMNVCHDLMAIFKGIMNSCKDNIQDLVKAIFHPVDFITNFCTDLGHLTLRASIGLAKFYLNPQPDHVYQERFEKFCNEISDKFANLPRDEKLEKIGHLATDFVIDYLTAKNFSKITSLTKNTAIQSTQLLSHSFIGKQTARIVGLGIEKGIANVTNAIDLILLEKNLIKNEEILQNLKSLSSKESFITKTVESAIVYKDHFNQYKNELIINFEKYSSNLKFRKQFEKHKLPIHFISETTKIKPYVQNNGTKNFIDKFGNIWTSSETNNLSKVENFTINCSQTGRKVFGWLANEPNKKNASSLYTLTSEKIVEKIKVPSLIAEKNKIQKFVKSLSLLQKD